MKKTISSIILLFTLLIGMSLLLYPSVSNFWNRKHQTQAIVDYEATLKQLAQDDYNAMLADAQAYNQALAQISYPLMNHTQIKNYNSVLNPGGTGIMGYICVPKLNIELPIYHGTSESVLQISVGHLEGTCLPIGGAGNHSVLSAHSGLPRAKLFTDLDKLELGDTFSLTVLDRVLTYQVDQILVVEPREVDALYPVAGEDLCTLITCTPYGINSHRLLVRGHRMEVSQQPVPQTVTADAIRFSTPAAAAILASPAALLLLVSLLPHPFKNRRNDRA